MMHEAGANASLTDGHRQSAQCQLLVWHAPHGPTDHPSRIQIQQDRHIEPPRPGTKNGDILGCLCPTLAKEQSFKMPPFFFLRVFWFYAGH